MTVATRLTLVEAAIAKLSAARGPKVSDILREARAKAIAGEVTPVLYDIAALEAEAKLPGLRGEMARAAIRVARGIASDGLLPVRALRQDASRTVGRENPAPDEPRRSTSHTVPATAVSGNGAPGRSH
jgi:hypothetical protein